ncbi:MAG: restriction endonuclease [bacterium]|nr:restriction endonuclease [bacterium]
MLDWKNQLYYGDNLPILKEYIKDESIDLIYLDPPFNSNRNYNVLFKDESGQESASQITAFEDTWHWDHVAEATFQELLLHSSAKVSMMLNSLKQFIGTNQVMAYLVMMTARLIELYRVLKPTGSLYLHCDPTASHYLKILLDTIFGKDRLRSEIIWKRYGGFKRSSARKFPHKHDTIFFYSKTEDIKFLPQFKPHKPEYLKRFKQDANGRHYRDDVNPTKGGRRTIYLDDVQGDLIDSLWIDINPVNPAGIERLGYPTQKPVALLERIIQASSNEGDVILDPFCGCGTTIHAAQKLKRRWIGIDITHLSIGLMKYRLKDAFNLIDNKDYQVIGEPVSIDSARQLAQENRYQFQWWAASLVQAMPINGHGKQGKKGSDKGIDGIINFIDSPDNKLKRVLVQVKSGKINSKDIRDLRGTIDRENAAIGVFITLNEPTRDMKTEAITSGYYKSEFGGQRYPRLQILTIEELLSGKKIDMPPIKKTFKQAQKEIDKVSDQNDFF